MQKWFEQIGYSQNPFRINPLAHDFQLIDRETELAEVFYRIRSSNMLFIECHEGSGKTHLLASAIKHFKGRIIYVNCARLRKQLDIEELLVNKYGFVRGQLLGNKPRHMILMLDNVSELTKLNSERIKYFFDMNYLSSVIFTGKSISSTTFTSSLRDRIGKRVINLKPLSCDAVCKMVESRLDGIYALGKDVIKSLYEISKKNPKQLLMDLSLLVNFSVEENKELSDIDLKKTLSKIKPKTDKKDIDFGDEEKIDNTELCIKCGAKLTNIDDYWRCENCDTCCGNCGTIIDNEDEHFCPGCGAEFVGNE